MSTVLVELSFPKNEDGDTVYVNRGDICLGSIRWDKDRGSVFHPTSHTGGLTMVEMGMIRSKMDDFLHGWA